MTDITLASRIHGSIYGVLTCDALGGPVQFQNRGSYEPVKFLKPLKHFGRPAGAWSDDGSMTLCLAQSFIDASLPTSPNGPTATGHKFWKKNAHARWEKEDYVRKICAWRTKGYMSSSGDAFDVGGGTSVALGEWQRAIDAPRKGNIHGLDVAKVQDRIDLKLKVDECSGNGSLMRCAPVALAFHERETFVKIVAREQSDITHPSPVCGDACTLYTSLMMSTLKGKNKDELAVIIARADISARVLRERLVRYKSRKDWLAYPEKDIKSSGWVVDTLEAALWCFFTTTNFHDGAVRAVSLGGDTDTIGAVYGGLAGAFYGIEKIPDAWRYGILRKDVVEKLCNKLVEVAQLKPPY